MAESLADIVAKVIAGKKLVNGKDLKECAARLVPKDPKYWGTDGKPLSPVISIISRRLGDAIEQGQLVWQTNPAGLAAPPAPAQVEVDLRDKEPTVPQPRQHGSRHGKTGGDLPPRRVQVMMVPARR